MDDKEQQTITLITHQKEILRSSKLRHLPVLTLRCRLSVGKCNYCFLVSHWGQNYIWLNSINSRATILLHILTFYDTTCRWKLVCHSNRRESVDWSLPVWSRTLFLQTCSLRCASQLSYLQTARPRAQYSYRYCNSGGDSKTSAHLSRTGAAAWRHPLLRVVCGRYQLTNNANSWQLDKIMPAHWTLRGNGRVQQLRYVIGIVVW